MLHSQNSFAWNFGEFVAEQNSLMWHAQTIVKGFFQNV